MNSEFLVAQHDGATSGAGAEGLPAVDPYSVEAAVEAAHVGVFPPFDFSAFASHLFWLAISFGLLYILVNRLIVPQVGGILEDRRDRVAGDLGEANRLREETDEVVAAYEAELADARARAHAIAQERREAIKREIDQERVATERSLQARIASSEETIRGMRDQALADVNTIAAEAARAILERVSPVRVPDPEIEAEVNRLREGDERV